MSGSRGKKLPIGHPDYFDEKTQGYPNRPGVYDKPDPWDINWSLIDEDEYQDLHSGSI
jgi:hypothetical protein